MEGSYSLNSSRNIQEFPVFQTQTEPLLQVLLKIKSNHGNPELTCVYQVQIHGKVANRAGEHDSKHVIPT
ncbi:hypothetical protein PSHT_15405 [Puccinia striiformis]|uniref:SUN domain-containing protein n=2 Tax=Puccinia striiformis TaxID=27350 RepID=A0A2S4UBG9_9BASI|nr:hypothetical protein PSTT_16744 [Puccinia striiformis]POV95940.1 hypothetical protein PSHT_15405 [Puccinia striiformis]